MKNRLQDFAIWQQPEPTLSGTPRLNEPKETIQRWVIQHTIPCLTGAFLLGATFAWLIKRR